MRSVAVEYGGIGDEAGASIEDQIRAHHTLGWQAIELRMVDGMALADLEAGAFDRLRRALDAAGLRVTAVASRIGNWDRPVTTPFSLDTNELLRLAPRMHQLGARYLRIMSYPNNGLPEEQWREQVLERIGTLVKLAEQEAITLVHENCSGWAGSSAARTLELLHTIDSPALRVLYDTGNPIAYGYDGLAYLQQVLPWVAHVHVKDAVRLASGETVFTYAGEGDARLTECLRLLLSSGYTGAWHIEPHLHLIPHLRHSGDPAARQISFLDYGRRFMTLVESQVATQGELP